MKWSIRQPSLNMNVVSLSFNQREQILNSCMTVIGLYVIRARALAYRRKGVAKPIEFVARDLFYEIQNTNAGR